MNEVLDFCHNLLSTNDWPPRWYCGIWSDFHGWLTIISDLMIWLAYFLIPIILVKVVQSRSDLPFLPVFWLFGAFIILCGFTHLIDGVIFWWPAYRVSTLVKFLTAIVSVLTVYKLIKTLPVLISMDNQREAEHELEEKTKRLSKELEELKKNILEKDIENEKLKIEIVQLKNRI